MARRRRGRFTDERERRESADGITRRDFLDGTAVTAAGLAVAAAAPGLTGAEAMAAAQIPSTALPASYYEQMRAEYQERRDVMLRVLREAGFTADPPQGAYYVMADLSSLDQPNDVAAARWLVEEVGVAAVPGSSFFSRPELGSHLLRFAFPKKIDTLEEAGRRLRGRGR